MKLDTWIEERIAELDRAINLETKKSDGDDGLVVQCVMLKMDLYRAAIRAGRDRNPLLKEWGNS